MPPRAVPPNTTVLLQPLVQPPPGTEGEQAAWADLLRELTAIRRPDLWVLRCGCGQEETT